MFFDTQEPLVGQDTDASTDIYERAGGSTTLISTGPDGGNGGLFSAFQGTTADGSRVFFHTADSLLAADTDGMQDVYERAGGVTTLVSQGPGAPTASYPATFKGASRDGTRVFFDTSEHLVGIATGIYPDIYERHAGTTTFLSLGPDGRERRLLRVLRRGVRRRHAAVLRDGRGARRRRHRQLAGRLLVLDHDRRVPAPEGRGAAARVAGPGL